MTPTGTVGAVQALMVSRSVLSILIVAGYREGTWLGPAQVLLRELSAYSIEAVYARVVGSLSVASAVGAEVPNQAYCSPGGAKRVQRSPKGRARGA
jgi:hypothetical protein